MFEDDKPRGNKGERIVEKDDGSYKTSKAKRISNLVYYYKHRELIRTKVREKYKMGITKTKNCIYCGTPIDNRSEYCKKCMVGVIHPRWKDTSAGYHAIHKWVERAKPKPKTCELCGKEKRLACSNNNGIYNRDIHNYEWICYSCHVKKDRLAQTRKRDDKGRFIKNV